MDHVVCRPVSVVSSCSNPAVEIARSRHVLYSAV